MADQCATVHARHFARSYWLTSIYATHLGADLTNPVLLLPVCHSFVFFISLFSHSALWSSPILSSSPHSSPKTLIFKRKPHIFCPRLLQPITPHYLTPLQKLDLKSRTSAVSHRSPLSSFCDRPPPPPRNTRDWRRPAALTRSATVHGDLA